MKTTLFAAAGAEEESLNPLIPHTAEMIIGLVVFALLYFAVKKFVVPNFEKAFADRAEAIEGGMEEAS